MSHIRITHVKHARRRVMSQVYKSNTAHVYKSNTAWCIWRVVSPISSLNHFSSSLRLFCHVPLKSDRFDGDWRIWLNDTPHAIGCDIWLTNYDIWLTNLRLEDLIEWHSTRNWLYCNALVSHLSHKSRATCEKQISNTWKTNVTHINDRCHTYQRQMSHIWTTLFACMGWLRLEGSIESWVSLQKKRSLQKRRYSAKETYKFIDPT